ncbi:alpha/beta hydrolase [Nocardia sp. NPDC005978]|uniref:alpha/beta fold hydrolase n=1 Tax=Nocardia sp. NPDC005978 TaxID=3156725 RepID=UPI0033A71E78
MRRFDKVDLGYEVAVSPVSGDSLVPIVFINALDTSQDQWDDVLTHLPGQPTITYDRPGIGASGPLPSHLRDQPRTLGDLADELRVLLDKLGIDTPHLVVGHSIGGLIALKYSERYADNTAGIVLVDATTLDHLGASTWPEHEGGEDKPGSSRLDPIGSFAEIQDAVWPPTPAVVVGSAVGRWLRLTPDEAEEYGPRTPEELDEQWQQGQQLLAEKIDALLVVADHAGHDIPTDQPELIAVGILAVIRAIDDRSLVTIPAAQLRSAGGSTDRRSGGPRSPS